VPERDETTNLLFCWKKIKMKGSVCCNDFFIYV